MYLLCQKSQENLLQASITSLRMEVIVAKHQVLSLLSQHLSTTLDYNDLRSTGKLYPDGSHLDYIPENCNNSKLFLRGW